MARMDRSEQGLQQAAASVLGGQQVLAAGVFQADPSFGKMALGIGVGGEVGQVAGDLAGGSVAGDVLSMVGMIAGMHAAKRKEAAKEGITPLVLVAVTDDTIHVLDWDKHAGPSRVVASLPRADTQVHAGSLGASRHLTFVDGDTTLKLEGATIGGDGEGDKAVVELLSSE